MALGIILGFFLGRVRGAGDAAGAGGEAVMIGSLLFGLLASHAVCDFALQSDVMAKGKNRHNRTTPPPGAKYQPSWAHWLTAHAMIHGTGVYVVTGIWWLGLAEAGCHWLIDFTKCDNRIGMNTDQALHIACKLAWAAVVVWLAAGRL